MKSFTGALLCAVLIAAPASAGILDSAKQLAGAELGALAASAIALILAGISGLFYARAVRTFREAGEFLTALSLALEDKRITRDELAQIIREGRDVFRAWN
jgi:hypothetical protein